MINKRDFFEHEFAELPAILRVILTTDGTVSTLLKHWFQEDVCVEVMSEKEVLIEDEFNASSKQYPVLERDVLLSSQVSGREFLRAHSYIYLDNIPQQLMLSIQEHPQGIGGALNETLAEHLRQVIGYGAIEGENAVWREYKVLMNGSQLMTICEIFPVDIYA